MSNQGAGGARALQVSTQMVNVLGAHTPSAESQRRLQTLRTAQITYATVLENMFQQGNRGYTPEQLNAITMFQTSCIWAQTAITIADPLIPTET